MLDIFRRLKGETISTVLQQDADASNRLLRFVSDALK